MVSPVRIVIDDADVTVFESGGLVRPDPRVGHEEHIVVKLFGLPYVAVPLWLLRTASGRRVQLLVFFGRKPCTVRDFARGLVRFRQVWKKRKPSVAVGRTKTPSQERDFEIDADYFMLEYPALSDKTRSVILSTFTSMVDVLNRGELRELFSGETNITPEATCDGAIILVDLPVKEFGEVGQFAQVLWKLAFQKAIERRNVAANPRPVFLWMDEAQFFVTGKRHDISKHVPLCPRGDRDVDAEHLEFLRRLGGTEKGKAETDSLFANLNTKILCANGDPITNDWAASIIGRSRQFFTNSSSSYEPEDWMSQMMGWRGDPRTSCGVSEQMEFEVSPRAFTTLRKGGPENNFEVDSIVFQGGRRFRQSGKTWLKVSFGQRQ